MLDEEMLKVARNARNSHGPLVVTLWLQYQRLSRVAIRVIRNDDLDGCASVQA
jgi:hypothetical protein